MGEGAEAAAAPAIKRRKMMTIIIAMMIDAAVMDDHVREERDDMNISHSSICHMAMYTCSSLAKPSAA